MAEKGGSSQKPITRSQRKTAKKTLRGRTVETLLEWEVNDRPFRKNGREYFKTVVSLAILASIIMVILREFLFILVVWAAVFLSWVLSTVPPSKVRHRLTTQGLISGSRSYLFRDMESFWFEERNGERVFHVNLFHFPWRLALVVNWEDEDKLKEIMVEYIPYREVVEKGRLDRLADWISGKLS